jgi:hypothetical protein
VAQIAAVLTDPQTLWQAVEAPAFVALADGNLAEAGAIYRANLTGYEFAAPGWQYLAAWSALRLGDIASAEADLAGLDAIGGHLALLDARRTALRAGIAGLASDSPAAIRLFETALVELRAIGAAFDEALVAILMASVLEPGPEVALATERAREFLVRVRARPFLEQLDGALTRPQATQRRTAEVEAVSVDRGR